VLYIANPVVTSKIIIISDLPNSYQIPPKHHKKTRLWCLGRTWYEFGTNMSGFENIKNRMHFDIFKKGNLSV